MLKCVITLIYCTSFMVSIYVEPAEVLNSETTHSDAEENLAELSPSDALPITLFLVRFENTVQAVPPDNIVEAWIENGKMVKGTTFSLWNAQSNQKFYCPKPDDQTVCLAPQEFNNSDVLKCSAEPIPFSARDPSIICHRGTSNSVFYNICENVWFSQNFQIYGFCFEAGSGNENGGKTLYTSHYIMSPQLLKSNLLLRERKLSYRLWYDANYGTKNLDELQNASFWAAWPDEPTETDYVLNPHYRVQLLVPKSDMAFGFWIKALHQYHNAELQHEDLFNLWDEITEKVKIQVIRMSEHRSICHIKTGVFDLELPFEMTKNQKYNMWVKLIICQSMNTSKQQGIVILMNNFINVDDPDYKEEIAQKIIDNYCERNRCLESFMSKVASVRGEVRCCRLKSSNLEFFGLEDQYNFDIPLITIPGLV